MIRDTKGRRYPLSRLLSNSYYLLINYFFQLVLVSKRHIVQPAFISLSIILCSSSPHLIIFTLLHRNKFLVVPAQNKFTLVKNCYFITKSTRGKPMADINCRFIIYNFIKFHIDFFFRDRVKRSRRLIKYYEWSLFIQCTCQGKFSVPLPLIFLHMMTARCVCLSNPPY